MDRIANKIANYILKDTDLDYEIVKYGIDAILSTVLCFSIALIVCTILGNFLFGLLFIIFLTPIKMQFLGYHCKTMSQCILTYSSCSGIILLINNYIVNKNIIIPLFIYVIVLFLIAYLVRAEINLKNGFILCIYFVLGIAFYSYNYQFYIAILLAVFFEFILLLLRHNKR